MNSYKTSNGERFIECQIQKKIREAKAIILQNQVDEFGYNFCETCGKNANNTILDCSHNYSVSKAKKEGKTELCWDVKNIKIRCRNCHNKYDNLDLKFLKK